MTVKSLLLLGVFLLSIPAVRAADAANPPRTYKIDSSTQIQLDDADATADQLKTGFHADVVEDTLQPGLARSIEAHTISAQGGKPQGGAKAAAPAAKGAKPAAPAAPASAPKHWTITTVSTSSITVEYK